MPNHVHAIIVLQTPVGADPPQTPVGADPCVRPRSWEHIIRGEADLAEIEQYIAYNPPEWAWDRENREAMLRVLRSRRVTV